MKTSKEFASEYALNYFPSFINLFEETQNTSFFDWLSDKDGLLNDCEEYYKEYVNPNYVVDFERKGIPFDSFDKQIRKESKKLEKEISVYIAKFALVLLNEQLEPLVKDIRETLEECVVVERKETHFEATRDTETTVKFADDLEASIPQAQDSMDKFSWLVLVKQDLLMNTTKEILWEA